MLDRLSEWYRVVTPNLTHEDLEKRKASVESLILTLKEKSRALIPEAVAGLVWHFDPDSEIVSTLVKAIRAQDLTFPTDIEENELELKVVAALALGEIVNNSKRGKARRLTAVLLVSGLGISRDAHSQTRYLTQMLGELRSKAVGDLDRESVATRQVPPTFAESINLKQRFNAIEEVARSPVVPNHPSPLWPAIGPMLQETFNSFQKRLETLELAQKVDREELEALWWSYSGRSKAMGEPFSRMDAGIAVLRAGHELADICLVPPLPSARYLLEDVVSRGRKRASQRISLESIVSEWTQPLVAGNISPDNARELAKRFPALLPISWIVQRLAESKMSADWTAELETMAGIKKDVALSVAQWAEQVLWEQVAQRVYEG